MKSCSLEPNVGDGERLGCLLVGGWMLLKGLVSRRALPTAMGGALLYRGFSGRCKCYEALGVDTASGKKSEN